MKVSLVKQEDLVFQELMGLRYIRMVKVCLTYILKSISCDEDCFSH